MHRLVLDIPCTENAGGACPCMVKAAQQHLYGLLERQRRELSFLSNEKEKEEIKLAILWLRRLGQSEDRTNYILNTVLGNSAGLLVRLICSASFVKQIVVPQPKQNLRAAA